MDWYGDAGKHGDGIDRQARCEPCGLDTTFPLSPFQNVYSLHTETNSQRQLISHEGNGKKGDEQLWKGRVLAVLLGNIKLETKYSKQLLRDRSYLINFSHVVYIAECLHTRRTESLYLA